MTQAV